VNLNPLGIGPVWQGNYQQPNTANPAPNPEVGITPVQNGNALSYPLPAANDASGNAAFDGTGVETIFSPTVRPSLC
jgi:hypothetical protein